MFKSSGCVCARLYRVFVCVRTRARDCPTYSFTHIFSARVLSSGVLRQDLPGSIRESSRNRELRSGRRGLGRIRAVISLLPHAEARVE